MDANTFDTVFRLFLIADGLIMIGIAAFVIRLYRRRLAERAAHREAQQRRVAPCRSRLRGTAGTPS